jgi:hypothetical protein
VSFPPAVIVVMMIAPVASPVLVVAAKAATVTAETVTVGVIVPVVFVAIGILPPENAPLVTKVAQVAGLTNLPER